MWNDHEALRAFSNLLIGVATALALYGAGLAVMRLPAFPLNQVWVEGRLAQVTRQQLETVAQQGIKGNFFTVDLEQTRQAFEKLPWVRTVSVRRQWPGRLEIVLEEHAALARWGALALVNTYGELFAAAPDEKLPLFVGPAGTSQEMAQRYAAFGQALAPLKQPVAQVILSPRRAWQLRLENGMVIELGRNQTQERLERFVALYERSVGRLGRRIDHVDLRYSNGFAVRLPGADLQQLDRAGPEPKAA